MSAATQQLRESFERFSKNEEPTTLGDEDTSSNLEVTTELQRVILEHHTSAGEQLKSEIEKIIKQYKKLKKAERSNLSHIKKLGDG